MIHENTLKLLQSRCWAEIDLDALRRNFALIKEGVQGKPLCAVVKADAYGHGDKVVARTLAGEGAAWFAVAALSEALRLRKSGIRQPILVLGYTQPELAPLLAENHITQAVFSLEYARALSDAARGGVVSCHLKVDTGMGRIGFTVRTDMEKALGEMAACFALLGLHITGIFQHFAAADSWQQGDLDYTEQQHSLFVQAVEALQKQGYSLETVHCCNSAGQMLHPAWAGDLARAGIILYGCAPSSETPFRGITAPMAVKARVSQVKDLLPGQSLSYGRTFTAPSPMRVATVCIGYADGYPRALSGKGVLALHGQAAPVVGRVCMDQLLVDVTHIPQAASGDIATVFGSGPADTAETIAEKTGTISYEILCGVSRRVPRLYTENGSIVDAVDYLD